MKKQNIYKGLFDYQSEFSHRYACWANNHMGWAKCKKKNKRLAKRKLKRILNKQDNLKYNNEYNRNIK